MDYSLALKLKLAKFPQGLTPNSEYYVAPNVIMRRKDIFQDVFHDAPREMTTTNEFVYKPRLEELIDACGDKFDCLSVEWGDKEVIWWSVSVQVIPFDKTTKGIGSSPEEAVANLWIKLHETN